MTALTRRAFSRLASIAVFAALLPFAQVSLARADGPVDTLGTRWAVGGYDVVAYFTDSRAVRGTEQFSTTWNGATWLFASDAHRQLFVAHPARYAPQYGGFCAYAAADGRLVRIDPTAFSIVGGKLYLNYSHAIQTQWTADRARYIREADARWPETRRRPAP